jgi:cation diffusion facilitator family transporter
LGKKFSLDSFNFVPYHCKERLNAGRETPMKENIFHFNKTERGALVSILVYISLSVVKLTIGYSYDSKALIADGFNNLTDIAVSLSVLIGLKISRKPADKDHAYGHSRAETIASMIASFIMITIGIQVIYNSIQSITDPNLDIPPLITLWTALGAVVVLYVVYRYNLQLSKKTNSEGLKAAAYDNRADALVSIGAAIGILGAQFGLAWLDPAAAFIVGIIICKTAWDIFRETSHSLSDGFDYDKLQGMKKTVYEVNGVEIVNDIKARKHGAEVIVDVTIKVAPSLDVVESHRITEKIERMLDEEYGAKIIQVHVEPVKEQ